jgi:hypothetical protein
MRLATTGSSRNWTALALLVVVVAVCVFALLFMRSHRQPAPVIQRTDHLGPALLYPDVETTPGAIDSRVSQENIEETICVPGWTKTVRPPVRFTNHIKSEMLQARGSPSQASDYELDHFIPLELGGCPDCKENLWLEPYDPRPGARQKDKVENYLHRQVCSRAMSLQDAQRAITSDWYKIYIQITPSATQ